MKTCLSSWTRFASANQRRRHASQHASTHRPRTIERFEDRCVLSVDFASAFSIGAALNDSALDIALDGAGNIAVLGSFNGTVDFDPGAGVWELTSTPAGSSNTFAAKYDPAGNFLWAQRMGGHIDVFGPSIAAGGDGAVYVSGSFTGTADFGATVLTSLGSNDVFAAKLDADGNFDWARRFGAGNSDRGMDVAADALGNSYLIAETRTVASGLPDAFLAKIDPDGDVLWTKQVGASTRAGKRHSSDFARGYQIALDSAGNPYAAGIFNGTVDFDPGSGISKLTGSSDGFIMKFESDGDFVWVRSFSGSLPEAHGLAVDAAGAVYSTGVFGGTVDFDPGPSTFNVTGSVNSTYVSKLDVAGNFAWAKATNSTVWSEHLALDNAGEVYVTGRFTGTADFDPGPGTFNLTPAGPQDAFVWKLSGGGSFMWAGALGGSDSDTGHGTAVDMAGNIYTTGTFRGTADFDPGPGTFNLTSSGGSDVFVSKLVQMGAMAPPAAAPVPDGGSLEIQELAKPSPIDRAALDARLVDYLMGQPKSNLFRRPCFPTAALGMRQTCRHGTHRAFELAYIQSGKGLTAMVEQSPGKITADLNSVGADETGEN